MTLIEELSADPAKNANQLVRWTANKEQHAEEFVEIVTAYFLQQRIKPAATQEGKEWDAYVEKVTLCHEMLVAAMKAKQTTDPQWVEKLESLVADFRQAYGPK